MRENRIINVRGTSGAGKTTLMRAIMDQYSKRQTITVVGRKQPLGYVLSDPAPQKPPLFVPGHYESACGGADTISKYIGTSVSWKDGMTGASMISDKPEGNSYDTTFGLIRQQYAAGFDVAFEGLLLSGDQARCLSLHKDGLRLSVVCINIPIDECLASVRARREAAGNTKPFNEDNTRDKHRLMQSCISKLRAAGIDVRDCPTRESARLAVGELLGLTPPETEEAVAP